MKTLLEDIDYVSFSKIVNKVGTRIKRSRKCKADFNKYDTGRGKKKSEFGKTIDPDPLY